VISVVIGILAGLSGWPVCAFPGGDSFGVAIFINLSGGRRSLLFLPLAPW